VKHQISLSKNLDPPNPILYCIFPYLTLPYIRVLLILILTDPNMLSHPIISALWLWMSILVGDFRLIFCAYTTNLKKTMPEISLQGEIPWIQTRIVLYIWGFDSLRIRELPQWQVVCNYLKWHLRLRVYGWRFAMGLPFWS
jgi:hypothetical protein